MKKQLTAIRLEIILDKQVILGEFNQRCVPGIRKACLLGGEKYVPEVIVEGIEYRDMEVVPKKDRKERSHGIS